MLLRLALVFSFLSIFGCGSSDSSGELTPVSGVITLNDSPAGNCLITFIPDGATKGNGGSGMSDSSGKYEINTPQGKKGLVAGRYKVTISRRLNKDGSLPDPNVPPIESSAVETLPPKYVDTNKTELSATVIAGDKKPVDFTLKTGKK